MASQILPEYIGTDAWCVTVCCQLLCQPV